MKPKLTLTIIALILSFISLHPTQTPPTVHHEKSVFVIKLASARAHPTISTKSNTPAPAPAPVAAPTPAPAQAPAISQTVATQPTPSAGCDEYLTLFEQYNWNVQDAIAICNAESSGNPNATHYDSNGSIDRGLMQINSVHDGMVSSPAQFYDPTINIATAYQIYSSSGWYAWSTAWIIGL